MDDSTEELLAEAGTIIALSQVSTDVLSGCVNATQAIQELVLKDWVDMKAAARTDKRIPNDHIRVMDSTYSRVFKLLESIEASYIRMHEIRAGLDADEKD